MIEDDLPSFLKLARQVSRLSGYKIKHGAVVVKNGRVLAVGCNKVKYSREFSSPIKRTLHAEAVALKMSKKINVTNGIVFVYREDRNGKIKLSKPCASCQILLKKYEIKRVFYSIEEYPFFDTMEL